MRTKTLLLTAALSAAGIASSMAQAVYSVNAVGYVNTTLVPGFNLISNPLDNKTGNTIGNLFGTGLSGGTIPDGFSVYYWDANIDDYVSGLYESALGGWQPASVANQVIPPGEGAFVFWPGTTNGTNTFVGEVLQAAASNQQIPSGFSIKGSTVPIAGTVTSMQFPVANGDNIFRWDSSPAVRDYVSYNYEEALGGWSPSVPSLAVGEAAFVFKTAPATWTRNFTINQ